MIDPSQTKEKAELFLDFEDRLTLFDALTLCRFYRDFYPWEGLGEMIHAVTGMDTDKESLKKIADSISNVVRQFNLREGLTPKDDRLPKGMHRELKNSGATLKKEKLEQMLQDYYRLRGWDEQGRLNPGQYIK